MNARTIPTADIFGPLFADIRREAFADIEPETRFSADWNAWQKRHWKRQGLVSELTECQALTRCSDDPCPPLTLGLAPFLEWSARQRRRG